MKLNDLYRSALGLIVTLVFIGVSEVLIELGMSPTGALGFVALVFAAYIGGLAPGLASAILLGVYQHMVLPPEDVFRIVIVNSSSLSIALMVGLLQRRARMVDTLNGNLRRLRAAVEELDRLIEGWDDFSEKGRLKQLVIIRHHLAHLATLVFGWRAIRKDMDETQARAREEYGTD